MSRATPEATGHQHRATTRSVSSQRPPGQQSTKQQSNNTPTKLTVLMAIAMRRYNTAHIARWRRSRASLEATGCHHWAKKTCSNRYQLDMPTPFFLFFSSSVANKDNKTTRIAPNNNKGMTDEKHLTSLIEYFDGGVSEILSFPTVIGSGGRGQSLHNEILVGAKGLRL